MGTGINRKRHLTDNWVGRNNITFEHLEKFFDGVLNYRKDLLQRFLRERYTF